MLLLLLILCVTVAFNVVRGSCIQDLTLLEGVMNGLEDVSRGVIVMKDKARSIGAVA